MTGAKFNQNLGVWAGMQGGDNWENSLDIPNLDIPKPQFLIWPVLTAF